ncbi:MAG: T9SS type A sorting domain-containing protein [Bacteroidetes bacterium]|nr:MAG: T9SS type A sorting domain-containing protein [Bacteroidota bacterium]
MKILRTVFYLFIMSTALGYSQFLRDQKIDEGEYFLNRDPGEGNGTPLVGSFGYWEVTASSVNLTDSVGSRLYVRFKSTNGIWSAPRCITRKEYFTNSGATLTYGEYFFNSDPGKGNGTPLNMTWNGIMTVDKPLLKRGDKIYFRIKDSFNRWSPARAVTFIFNNISKAEYYIKRQGSGQTTPATMNLNVANDSNAIFYAIKDSIPARTNDTLFVRFQTEDKFYSKWTSIIENYPVRVKEEKNAIPNQFKLEQNYPNPFNPTTVFSFQLPVSSYATLKVYDVLGREVAIVLDGMQDAGFKMQEFNASSLPSGIYYYKLTAIGQNGILSYTDVKKLLLIK